MLQGDLSKSSLYREEAVEAITESLDCPSTKVQEQSSKALLMLGGCFSYNGEATAEDWLLQQAGFHERLRGSFRQKEMVDGNLVSFNIATYQQNKFTSRKSSSLKKN
jgi:hypothetical protein